MQEGQTATKEARIIGSGRTLCRSASTWLSRVILGNRVTFGVAKTVLHAGQITDSGRRTKFSITSMVILLDSNPMPID